MSAPVERPPMPGVEHPESRPEAGGAYLRQPDGTLRLVEGGTTTPDRIAPDLREPPAPRPTRSRRS